MSLAAPGRARLAVVLLAGLNGHYRDTWGDPAVSGTFVHHLVRGMPEAAVFAYDYPASLFGFLADGDLSVNDIAGHFARVLRSTILDRFDVVGLVGYCLGGSVATLALREILPAMPRERPSGERIVLFLVDVPHAWPVDRSDLGTVLGMTLSTLHENAAFVGDPGVGLLTYALVSAKDRWMAGIHASAGLPPARVRAFDRSHEEMCAGPEAGAPGPFQFLCERLRAAVRDARPSAGRGSPRAPRSST